MRFATRVSCLAVALLAAGASAAPAQRYDWTSLTGRGQSPGGLEWKRIRTPHFDVVFPAANERDAQRVASTLERAYAAVSKSMGVAPSRITVLLPTQSAETNGAVALGPRRSVWFNTPPQQPGLLGAGDWYELLAAHELRHVAQLDRSNTGLTRVLAALTGEFGRALPYLVIPGWVYEGDAIGTETALTRSGRGRMPSFDMEMRAMVLTGEQVSYETAMHGSYGRWVPSEYHMGYLLTTHVKRKHGADAWGRVIARASARIYDPFAFSHALSHVTGRSARGVYDDAIAELRTLWSAQRARLTLTDGRVVSPAVRGDWTSWTLPRYDADGSIVALRYGLDDRFRLVRITAARGETELIPIAPGDGLVQVAGPSVSVAGGRAAWTESRPDARWGLRDWSVVRVHDLASRRTWTLGTRTRLHAPALSSTGDRIAAVEVSTAGVASLVVLDAVSGAELRRIAAPEGEVLTTPAWTSDGAAVVVGRQGRMGKALAIVDVTTGTMRDVLAPAYEDIGRIAVQGPWIYHESARSGIDNIWAVDINTGARYQVTSREFGAFAPAVSEDGRRLLFADYTPRGFDVVEMDLDPATWTRLEDVREDAVRYWEPVAAQEAAGDVFDDVPTDAWPVTSYRSLPTLSDLHTHVVIAVPGDATYVELGTANKQQTIGATVAYDYDAAAGTNAWSLAGSYAGWYPILDLGVEWGTRGLTDDSTGVRTDRWRERAIEGGFRLPLDLSRGIFRQRLELGVHGALVDIDGMTSLPKTGSGNGRFAPVTYELQMGRTTGWIRSLRPDVGQAISLTYRHTPFGGDYRGSQVAGLGTVYLPGIAAHHSTRIRAGAERQQPDGYRFGSRLPTPRGFDPVTHDQRWLSALDYSLPLAYPDLNLKSIVHIQRVSASVFHDLGQGRTAKLAARRYHSAGTELMADVKLLNILFGFQAGSRLAYLASDRRWVLQPVIRAGF